MSIANYVPKHRRKAVSLMMHKAKAAKRIGQDIDADTLRMRSLWDAKGQVLREGVTYKSTGEVAWAIARSIHGRINQIDVIVNGSVWATAGARRLRAKGIQI